MATSSHADVAQAYGNARRAQALCLHRTLCPLRALAHLSSARTSLSTVAAASASVALPLAARQPSSQRACDHDLRSAHGAEHLRLARKTYRNISLSERGALAWKNWNA